MYICKLCIIYNQEMRSIPCWRDKQRGPIKARTILSEICVTVYFRNSVRRRKSVSFVWPFTSYWNSEAVYNVHISYWFSLLRNFYESHILSTFLSFPFCPDFLPPLLFIGFSSLAVPRTLWAPRTLFYRTFYGSTFRTGLMEFFHYCPGCSGPRYLARSNRAPFFYRGLWASHFELASRTPTLSAPSSVPLLTGSPFCPGPLLAGAPLGPI